MKFLKAAVIGLVVFTFVWMIYFATQVSATYPPLRTYSYAITDDDLYRKLCNVDSLNEAWTFVVTDSTGEVENQKYYCELSKVTATDSLTFSIFFQSTDRLFDKKTKSEMGLVQVWDNIKWKGGTKKDDPEVDRLVKLFETEIVKQL